jgi:type VI secretion system protein
VLILQIQSYQKQSPNQTSTLTLDQGSITIGRDITNDWSLSDPDRVLSKRHCRIECRDGSYFLTDTSTNGVFVNALPNEIGRDNSVVINSGDVIRMGDYEIGASIENVQPSPVIPPLPVSPVANAPIMPPPPLDDIPENNDWKKMLEPASAQIPFQTNVDGAHAVDVPAMTQSHYDAPSAGMSIPDDWGMSDIAASEPLASHTPPTVASQIPPVVPPKVPEPTPSAPSPLNSPVPSAVPEPVVQVTSPVHSPMPEPVIQAQAAYQQPESFSVPDSMQAPVTSSAAPGQGDDLLKAFLNGAGIDPDLTLKVGAEVMMNDVGNLFRQATMGLMGVLAARGDIKGEFRLSQTMIRPTENNPLKFSLNIDEAMIALLNKKGAGYMAADSAFEEAFDDLKAHQVAVLSGMQEALKSLLKKFDPEIIQQREANASGMKKLLGGSKSKYWDDFVSLYQRVSQDTEDDFQNSFGREFAKAYEQQIQNQKTHKS